MSSANLIYELHAIQHRYSARLVLDVEQLEVRPGETLAIVGPSGSGKSTLLRLMQFVERPSAGRIVFDGQAVDRHPRLEARRRVTTVFQRPVLLDRSVRDNVAYGLSLRGRRDGRDTVERLIDQLGLAERARDPARALSGGEIQRVALARALAIAPDVLLLDEPTANLDPHNVALIENIIRDQRTRGVTIVLVTHHIFQARRLADRTGLLLAGRLIEIAPTHDLFESPRDPRTRAFLSGEMVY
jgi:tungstate transport system ATP-binding protein